VANKISNKYQKPCFALVRGKGKYGGSGRSVFGYNISQNITKNKDLDIDGGGHAEACALSISENDFDEFKNRCFENYQNFLDSGDCVKEPVLNVDFEIDFSSIDYELIDDINKLRPFGNGNDEVTFCTKNVEVVEKKVIGKKKNALRFVLKNSSNALQAIVFNDLKDHYLECFDKCKFIDLVYTLTINEFAGKKSIQIMPIDFKKS